MINLYIGLNGSGKSQKIKEEYEQCKEENKIFIPADPSFDEKSKEGKKKETTPYDDLLSMVLKSFPDDVSSDIDENFSKIIKKFNENMNKYSLTKEEMNDVDNNYKDILSEINSKFYRLLDPDSAASKSNLRDALVSANLTKSTLFKGSSDGDKEYILLLYILKLMVKHKKTKFVFYIDEIEKHLHKTLISQLCKLIIELSEHNDFYIVTHSEFVVDLLFEISNIKYFYKNNGFYSFDIKVPQHKARHILRNFLSIFFDERLIIVEGHYDRTLFEMWINETDAKYKLLEVKDMDSKDTILPFLKWVQNITNSDSNSTTLLQNYLFKKIFLIYDKDNEDKEKTKVLNSKISAYEDKLYASLIIDPKLEMCFASGCKNDIYSELSEYGNNVKDQFLTIINNWK